MDMSILVDKRQREFGISKVDPNLMPGHTIDSSIIRIFQKDSYLKNHFFLIALMLFFISKLLAVKNSITQSCIDILKCQSKLGIKLNIQTVYHHHYKDFVLFFFSIVYFMNRH